MGTKIKQVEKRLNEWEIWKCWLGVKKQELKQLFPMPVFVFVSFLL